VQDAVASYCAASEAGDMAALEATFAPDVDLPSPLLGSFVFKGASDVGFVLRAVYGLIRNVRWDEPIGTGEKRLAIAHARVAGLAIDDAMYFELAEDGRIRSIRPHLRPLLATLVFTLLMGPRVIRRPGVVARAVRRR
jgi:SnoaL-like domain